MWENSFSYKEIWGVGKDSMIKERSKLKEKKIKIFKDDDLKKKISK